MEYSDILRCYSGYRHCTEFLKTYPESSYPDGFEHIVFLFWTTLSRENPSRKYSSDTDRRGLAGAKTGWHDESPILKDSHRFITALLNFYDEITGNKLQSAVTKQFEGNSSLMQWLYTYVEL
jgi:hypothetical protein